MILVLVILTFIISSEQVSKKDIVEITFPHRSSVVISGIFAATTEFQMTITGGEISEKVCIITISPLHDRLKIENESFKYAFGKISKGMVPFWFNIITLNDDDKSVNLAVSFNGNDAGPQDYEKHCPFHLADDVYKITFENFEQIKNLSFGFAGDDEGATKAK